MNQHSSEENRPGAFDPENFNTVLLIQMMRTYDLLLALLSVHDPAKAMELSEIHEQGGTFTPPPAFEISADLPDA